MTQQLLDAQPATLYIRNNRSFGASCDGTRDTGHAIFEDGGLFTVYSIHDDDRPICTNATREQAEKAITDDWRAA